MADEPREIVPVADHAFRQATLVEAGHLAQHAPAQLTDTHLAHLACYLSEDALADVIRRRAVAEDAAEIATWQRYNATFAETHPVVVTKAVEPAPLEGIDSFADLAARMPEAPVPMAAFAALATFAEAMNAKNVERNQRLDALEALTQKLAERVLELEADRAAAGS